MARTIHLVTHEDPELQNSILQKFIARFRKGDTKRMKYTVPASCFALFRLIHFVKAHGAERIALADLLNQIKELIELIQSQYAELAIRLYLNFILCINEVDDQR